MLALLHVVFWYGSGRSDFYRHFGEADRELGVGELRLYLFMLLIGLPAGACIVHGLGGLPFSKLKSEKGLSFIRSFGRKLWFPALLAALGSFVIAHFVTDYAWFTDDEQAYLFQAKLYAQGRLTIPRFEPHVLLNHRFVVDVLAKDGVPQVTGVYPPLQPLIIALSGWFGNLHLSQFVCVGLITYHTGRLAELIFGKKTYGVVAAWLCATSPLLLGLGATLHTSILGTVLSLFTLRLWLWLSKRGGVGPGAVMGLVAGSLVLARPLEGVLVLGLSGGALLALCLFHGRHPNAHSSVDFGSLFRALVGMSLGALLPLSILAIVNVELTGNAFHGAYFNLEQQVGRFMGFGHHMMWGRTHSFELGIVQTITALVRVNAFIFGWPLSLGLAVLSAFKPFRSRVTLLFLGFLAIHLSAYFFLAFGSVHDFGHAYHVWHLPLIASLSAWVLVQCYSFASANSGLFWRKLPKVACAMAVVAWAVFWPAQIRRWHDISEIILAPIRAVEAARQGEEPTVVLWTHIQPPGPQKTWVLRAPAPLPDGSVLWAQDVPRLYPLLKDRYPDHAFLRLAWIGDRPVAYPVGR